MNHMMKKIRKLFIRQQKGQILVLVLILIVLGALIITPLLTFMASGLKNGRVYEDKTEALYAADSGIEDGKWKIEYNKLDDVYPYYNFTESYSYYISEDEDDEIGENINGNRVKVTLQNIWIPEDFVPTPDEDTAEAVINDKKLVITGATTAGNIEVDDPDNPGQTIQVSQYKIKVVYDYMEEAQAGNAYSLTVDKIGIWLPRGFEYFSDEDRNYEGSPMYSEPEGLDSPYTSTPELYDTKGSQMIVWEFVSEPVFSEFPASVLTSSSTNTLEFTFFYRPLNDPNDQPDAVAWITTTGKADGLNFSWNANIKVYRIESEAGDTSVEAYISKDELAVPSSAVAGDYYATGNTLMEDTDLNHSSYYGDPYYIRDSWVHTDTSIPTNSSSATVATPTASSKGIPADADVSLAYLYWTSWYAESSKTLISPLNPETCGNADNWNKGNNWDTKGSSNKYFNSHDSNGNIYSSRLTLKNEIDLSDYASSLVTISWKQWLDVISSTSTTVFSDMCSNLNNWDTYSTSGSQIRIPTADGDSSGTWNTAPCWDDVDETTADDSNYMTGTTDAGGYQLFTFPAFSVPAGQPINSLTLCYRVRDASGGPGGGSGKNSIYPYIKVNGNRYSSASDDNPGNNWETYSYSFTTNPATDSAWTADDINGTGSNPLQQFGVYSTDLNPDIRVSMVYAKVEYGSDSLWSAPSNSFRGTGAGSATDEQRTLTLKNSLDLSSYASSGTVTLSWDQSTNNNVDSTDSLYYALYNGSSWSANTLAFSGSNPDDFSITLPNSYLTSGFKIRFYLDFNNSDEYVTLDNIKIIYYANGYDSSDGLNFSFSGDDGFSWSDDIRAFRFGDDDISAAKPSSNNFTYTVPVDYLTSDFLIRFTLVGCDGASEAVNLDDITLCVMVPDTSVAFKIDNQQVYLDSDGQPQEGSEDIAADRSEVILNVTSGESMGFSYSCFKDVTALVREYTRVNEGEENEHSPGLATYTVGDVGGTLGDENKNYQLAHAGWSLIIVYTSAETEGHQLYLFDRFTYEDDYTDLDFDNDGNPGGDISGFIVPEKIEEETDVAKMTVFVGEGDDFITGDFIAFQAPDSYWKGSGADPSHIPYSYKLWDGINTDSNTTSIPDNVWNGQSQLFTADGVDIDTFNITWDSEMIEEGDTRAHVDIYTEQDNWNLVYIILSFRSVTTTGGALSYLIED